MIKASNMSNTGKSSHENYQELIGKTALWSRQSQHEYHALNSSDLSTLQ